MPEASKETERSYLFKTNNLLVNAGIVAGAEKHLTQLSSEMKEEEKVEEPPQPTDSEDDVGAKTEEKGQDDAQRWD